VKVLLPVAPITQAVPMRFKRTIAISQKVPISVPSFSWELSYHRLRSAGTVVEKVGKHSEWPENLRLEHIFFIG